MDVTLPPPAWATHLVGDWTDWLKRPLPLADLPTRFVLPEAAYVEYAWQDEARTVRADPANPVRADNPWWPTASAIVGPAYAPHRALGGLDDAPRGRLTRHRLASAALGQERRLLIYTPAGFEGARLPLVIVQDGVASLHIGRLDRILEAQVARGAARPAHLAFLEPQDRGAEYRFSEAYRAFVTREAAPFVEAQVACTGERALLGASPGGLVSAWTAWTTPGFARTVVAQSGAFLIGPGDDPRDPYRGSEWLVHAVRAGEGPALRWALDCGTLEWLTPVNRRLFAALGRVGAEVRYAERHAGHNWVNWRNGLPDLLGWALDPRDPG